MGIPKARQYITVRVAAVITDDGTITHTYDSKGGIYPNEVKILENFQIKAVSGDAFELIDYYDLNSDAEISLRKKFEELEQAYRSETAIDHIKPTILTLGRSLQAIATLSRNSRKHKPGSENLLRMMIYANIISTLEEFLFDCLIKSIKYDEDILKHLVTCDCFNKEKYTIKDLITSNKTPKDLIIEKLQNIVFHNFKTVNELYTAAFQCKLDVPSTLHTAITNRHDIVHRNGIPKGIKIDEDESAFREAQRKYSTEDVEELILTVLDFSKSIIISIENHYSAPRLG